MRRTSYMLTAEDIAQEMSCLREHKGVDTTLNENVRNNGINPILKSFL